LSGPRNQLVRRLVETPFRDEANDNTFRGDRSWIRKQGWKTAEQFVVRDMARWADAPEPGLPQPL
jgi:hypothetical protein